LILNDTKVNIIVKHLVMVIFFSKIRNHFIFEGDILATVMTRG
jgi:hypothetical protein